MSALRIHYTHHACRALRLTTKWEGSYEDIQKASSEVDRRHQTLFGGHRWQPSPWSCNHAPRGIEELARGSSRLTTDPGKVTCTICIDRLDRRAEQMRAWNADEPARKRRIERYRAGDRFSAGGYLGDVEYSNDTFEKHADEDLVWHAWLTCCRFHGAPSPASEDHTRKALEIMDRQRRLKSLHALDAQTFASPMHDARRERLEQVLAELDPDLRELLDEPIDTPHGRTSILGAITFGNELLDHALEQFQAASTRIKELVEHVSNPQRAKEAA